MTMETTDGEVTASGSRAIGRRVSEIVVMAMGGVSILLGTVVLTGWYTHNATLIQVHPAFVPMQYNTALCFLLCGAGMLSLVFRRVRVGTICGGIAGAIGALTLIEYISGLSLGIDQLLMEHYILVEVSHPGRMAPNTALCFSLTGIALLTAARFRKRFLLLSGLGALVLVLASMAFMGYVSGASTAYGWGQMTRMAAHTSAGFIAVGVGILSLAFRRKIVADPEVVSDPTSQRRKIVSHSIIIMAVVSLGVAMVVIRELQETSTEQSRMHLSMLVKSWNELITAAVGGDQLDSARRQQDGLESIAVATLRQVAADYEELGVFGESGELVLARREGEQIAFLIARQQNPDIESAQVIPIDVGWAEPMRRALRGESGTLIGLDYHGELVLAAYEPVGQYGWGLVGKVDLAEIGAPFTRSSVLAGGFALVLVGMGVLALLITLDPTVRGLAQRTVELQGEVAERRRAEEELRQYEYIVSNTHDMLALLDERYVYLATNPAYLQAFGKAPDEVIGRTVAEVFGEEFFSTVIRPRAERCLTGESIRYQDWFEFPITGRRYMDIAYEPYLGSGAEVQGYVVAARDITRRKQVEEEKLKLEAHLRQQQKLESIGTLAGGVAHEINNPITGIMNYAQLIDERLDPESPLREFAVGIGRETKRVASIVSNLLAFARQERQSHSPARIEDIVNDTVSLIGTIIRRDQITLEVDVPDDLPEIKCRSQQIQQVLMNLLINARDALNRRYPEHDPNKIMRVTVRPFEKEDRPWIRTTIEDHGVGIPDEIRDRIFDPFFTTKDRAEGTGLGLSVSHGIIQEHHGELSVECEAGRYTRFHLDLPVDNGWTQHPVLDEASEVAEAPEASEASEASEE